jgi:cystathionine gamma-synthase
MTAPPDAGGGAGTPLTPDEPGEPDDPPLVRGREGGRGREPGFSTLAIHAGQAPDRATGAVVPPIHLASTFAQEAVGKHAGFEYARTGNPTRATLETALAALERARYGFAFASGMAGEDAVLRFLRPGDHVLIPDDAYGGTFRLIARIYSAGGVEYTPVHLPDPAAVAAAWRPTTRLVWVETPSNPLLNLVDIAAIAAIAHTRDGLLVVDNTFATPYLQRPLALGADIVVHSSTKYLGGHSDVVGGFVATDDAAIAERLSFTQNAVGAVPSPFDCYLLLRGVKTLELRMDRQCANARAVVDLLERHRSVSRVFYPGLATHPGHDIAARQMRDFGAMASFLHADGEEGALEMVTRTRIFTLAESLGAVESLIEHPARMTHASTAGSPLEVDPALVRLSVGIENAEDLIEDLETALA